MTLSHYEMRVVATIRLPEKAMPRRKVHFSMSPCRTYVLQGHRLLIRSILFIQPHVENILKAPKIK